MTLAVLMLTNSAAVNVSGWVIVGVLMLSAAVGAVGQWVASATPKQRATTAAITGSLFAAVMLVWDCGWVWDWACYFPLW